MLARTTALKASTTIVASGQSGSQTLGGIGTAGRRFTLKSGSFTLASVDTHAIPPPEVATTVSIDYDELGHVIARRDASPTATSRVPPMRSTTCSR